MDMCEVRVRTIKKRKLDQLVDTSNESTSEEIADVDKDEADAVVISNQHCLAHFRILKRDIASSVIGLVIGNRISVETVKRALLNWNSKASN